MHETGIALSIHRMAREAMNGAAGGRLEAVKVAVGELSAVDPELLVFAWEAVVAEGADAGAVLEVKWCPARRHCPRCGEDKAAASGSWIPLCNDCAEPICVEGGNELDLLEVAYSVEDLDRTPDLDRTQ